MSPTDFDRAQRAYDAQEDPAYYDHEPDEDTEDDAVDFWDDVTDLDAADRAADEWERGMERGHE